MNRLSNFWNGSLTIPLASPSAAFLSPLFRWISIEFIHKRFSPDLARRLAKKIRENYQTLKPALFVDLAFLVEEKRYPCSSFMYGTASSLFLDLIHRALPKSVSPELGSANGTESFDRDKAREFAHIHEYVLTGKVQKLSSWIKERSLPWKARHKPGNWMSWQSFVLMCRTLYRHWECGRDVADCPKRGIIRT